MLNTYVEILIKPQDFKTSNLAAMSRDHVVQDKICNCWF